MTKLCNHVLGNGYCQKEKLDDNEPYCEDHMAIYDKEELENWMICANTATLDSP